MANRRCQGPGLTNRDFSSMPGAGRLSCNGIPATTDTKESDMQSDKKEIPSVLRTSGEAEGAGHHA